MWNSILLGPRHTQKSQPSHDRDEEDSAAKTIRRVIPDDYRRTRAELARGLESGHGAGEQVSKAIGRPRSGGGRVPE